MREGKEKDEGGAGPKGYQHTKEEKGVAGHTTDSLKALPF